mmetsp:Transcript_32244/g.63520  ORF Transcript_32244/g.63520 Transcript_32244/m.63520 type:complete len:84 (+) Transcript_32244:243-494(+)
MVPTTKPHCHRLRRFRPVQPKHSAFATLLDWAFLWHLLYDTSFTMAFAVHEALMQNSLPGCPAFLLADAMVAATVTDTNLASC